mmetsp:Transcript_63024/g.173099  ORF Transcript_63024/g.173099 Transcript_63024/m.173099 type:complete len:223 (-) Transcript_63024:867-1535(-)
MTACLVCSSLKPAVLIATTASLSATAPIRASIASSNFCSNSSPSRCPTMSARARARLSTLSSRSRASISLELLAAAGESITLSTAARRRRCATAWPLRGSRTQAQPESHCLIEYWQAVASRVRRRSTATSRRDTEVPSGRATGECHCSIFARRLAACQTTESATSRGLGRASSTSSRTTDPSLPSPFRCRSSASSVRRNVSRWINREPCAFLSTSCSARSSW